MSLYFDINSPIQVGDGTWKFPGSDQSVRPPSNSVRVFVLQADKIACRPTTLSARPLLLQCSIPFPIPTFKNAREHSGEVDISVHLSQGTMEWLSQKPTEAELTWNATPSI